jgi:hypothetical protein
MDCKTGIKYEVVNNRLMANALYQFCFIASVNVDVPKPMIEVLGKPILEYQIEAVRLINQSGYLDIVVTNQPVIARGEVSLEELGEIHCKMETLLGREGAYVDDIFSARTILIRGLMVNVLSTRLNVAGNGGSASDADHIVGELMKFFLLHREIGEEFSGRLVDVAAVWVGRFPQSSKGRFLLLL